MANLSDANIPLDSEWVRGSFLIPNILLEGSAGPSNQTLEDIYTASTSGVNTTTPSLLTSHPILEYRYWTSAYLKITNTQLGGNIGVNCKPQFTRYADIRVPGLIYNNKVTVPVVGKNGTLDANAINTGMGRYYSEAIDDKAQRIYMRFGVPMFNSLTNFLSNVFNNDLGDLSNKGRAPSAFYYLGYTLGAVSMFTAFPVTDSLLTGVEAITRIIDTMGFSSFYSMKPTMPLYWSAVNDLVNQIATYRGILPTAMLSNTTSDPIKSQATAADIATYNKLLPNIFTKEGALNVYAMANKTQLMFDVARHRLKQFEKSASTAELTMANWKDTVTSAAKSVNMTPATLQKAIKNYKQTVGTLSPSKSSTKTTNKNPAVKNQAAPIELLMYIDSKDSSGKTASKKLKSNWTSYFKSLEETGGGWAVFVVDSTGPQSESFSNDVGESSIAGMLNNVSADARRVYYNFDDGNIGGVIGTPIQKVVDSAKSFAKGALDGVGVGGIVNMLFGNGFVEIPKFWTGSSANLQHGDYTFDLVSPYGNPISQLQNIYLPLAMLMAGALPLATGKQSYTSPFLCQIFDRGKLQIQLGIIDSFSITRGTTSLPYNQEWRMLGAKVSISVIDMSNIMFMPLSGGSFFKGLVKKATAVGGEILSKSIMGLTGSNTAVGAVQGFAGTLDLAMSDQNTVLYDYLLVLAGADAQNSLYFVSKARMTLANNIKYASELNSSAYWATKMYGFASNTWAGGVMSRIWGGFSINAELQTPADLATTATLNAQSTLNNPLGQTT